MTGFRRYKRAEMIAVYGDYDVDGVTATVLLYSYLREKGGDVIYYIPERECEGYGLNRQSIDYLHQQGVKLIVTVDNGISACDEIDYAAQKGIDVVVTDHHEPPKKLPGAVAVVTPKRADCERVQGICRSRSGVQARLRAGGGYRRHS